MFSKGQLIFAVIFVILFTISMLWSYKRDKKLHKLYYNNWFIVLFAAIIIVAIFTVITFSLH